MRQLLLIRHGDTGLTGPTGHVDLPLTKSADALWPRVRERLTCAITHPHPVIITTNLTRCHQYAVNLASLWNQLVHVDNRLLEQDFGDWSGQTWDALGRQQEFFADPVNQKPPNGESFSDCAKRSEEWLSDSSNEIERDGSIVVLAHAGSLRAVLGKLIGIPLDRTLDLSWSPFGLTELKWYSLNRSVLLYHNKQIDQ